MAKTIKCPNCGASVPYQENATAHECEFCGADVIQSGIHRALHINFNPASIGSPPKIRKIIITALVVPIVLSVIPFILMRSVIPSFTSFKIPGLKQAFSSNSVVEEIRSFGSEGTGIGMFKDPRAVATDTKDNIFVADYQKGRIQMFDAKGQYIKEWNLGKKAIIQSLGVDRNGILYASNGGKIHRINTQTGVELPALSNEKFGYISHFSLRQDGKIVVYSDYTNQLLLLDANGNLIQATPCKLADYNDDDSDSVDQLMVNGENKIYILGTFSEKIYHFNEAGKFLNQWGSESSKDAFNPQVGQFSSPLSIASDGKGHIFVGDMFKSHVFDSNGRGLDTFDIPLPYGMAVNTQNELVITDSNAKKIHVYRIKI
jgi:hypothetical protein